MRIRYAVLAVAVVGALAGCGGGDAPDEVRESPTAAPGMQDEVEPTLGPGATEAPDVN